jgi:hypothetical protein
MISTEGVSLRAIPIRQTSARGTITACMPRAYALSDSGPPARRMILARNASAAASTSSRPSGSPCSIAAYGGALPQPLSARSREATSRSYVLCSGSWAIDHHSSTNAIPSSPTNSCVVLDRPRGRPEGYR